ncbi:ATP-binding protein [Oscillatoria acuminata]|uniref:Bacteriophytochrome (Light-regulated signal transduction histidine kinase) n=1 Tax=Oscillatoria acuminata PCC 6304 TaxID=56110 RepID=K9TR12_9CYAN|nr:ATP-binding protein [Oscillatoria acuminata]AFY84818.1 bacteriophytochrome (light-regulated signal transduction histidine kinase) [Oscillatoria acuminata PCC 6304]
MMQPETVSWANYEREPIQSPGLIQPHGVLFVLSPDLKILQVSNNTVKFFGRPPERFLGKPLQTLLDAAQINVIHESINYQTLGSVNPLNITIHTDWETLYFDGIIHHSHSDCFILELEPALSPKTVGFLSFYKLVEAAASTIQNSQNFQELCEFVVKEVRNITGFDRVMLYRFDPAGHGTVLAEEKQESMNSWLNLHYPAEDIPTQARQLYSINLLRLISDVNYKPVAIVPTINPVDKRPLDLSHSVLRSVSPCHIEYLQNMKVSASMSISIVKEGKLWGLVACHHNSPKYVSYEVRKACEFFGKVMALELRSKEDNSYYEYRLQLQANTVKLVEYMSRETDFIDGLVNFQPNLLDLGQADGAVIYFKGTCCLLGQTPSRDRIERLIHWLEQQNFPTFYHTDSLPSVYPEAEIYKDIASGLLAVAISKEPKHYVLWFRSEVIHQVSWAGDPNTPFELLPGRNPRLHPRKSFEVWQEIVKLKSLPWKPCEIDAALDLKNAIVTIVLRQADELAKLNVALQESEARTKEKANQLAQTLQELKRTQTQLIEQEKMSELGELIASIVAEITNPINFITGNLSHAQEYAEDLLNLLYLYQQHYPEPVPEILETIESIDLEFTSQDFCQLIESMKGGAERIRDLVHALRNFMRLNESDLKAVDIHEGINSTLLILQHRLKGKGDSRGIQVVKAYGNLPQVECYPSQLNQVFMNLLSNAIEALESHPNHPGQKTILIRTEPLGGDRVLISIADNGVGINPTLQDQIFEPFFTTKSPKKSIGVGLAIAKEVVVEKHQGEIRCISELSQGAEFILEIPTKQPYPTSVQSVDAAG